MEVTEVRKVRKTWYITVGSERYRLPDAVYRERPLSPGEEVDPDEFDQWLLLRQYRPALEYAVSLLAQRPFAEKELEARMMRAEFNFDDFYDQIQQMKNMGGINSILSMMPNMGDLGDLDIDDNAFKTTEAIINSMTKAERAKPDLINPSRKRRIADGAGVDIAEVNRLMKQFEQMRKMMKQMGGMMKGKKGLFGKKNKLPFNIGF